MFTCDICLEDNITDNNKLNCPYCNGVICKSCCQQWLLQQIITYECPYCKKPWNLSFLYSNLSLTFINKQLKENYAKICTTIDNVRFLNPLQEEFKFIKNIDFIFKRLFKIVDFNKFKKYIYFSDQTIDKNIDIYSFLDFYYDFRPDNYYNIKKYNKPIENEEYNNYINQINKIKQLYSEFVELIDFNTFLHIFSTQKSYSVELTIFLFYNILIDTFDDLKNNYDNFDDIIKFFNTEQLYTKYCKSIKKKEDMSIDNFYIIHKNDNKYEIIKILHELVKPFKNNILNQKEKVNKRKSFKCEKPNCNGTVYKYEHQAICNECKSIFCSKCHTEIFPEKIEYSMDNEHIYTMINPKYKEYTKKQKIGKYPEKYIKSNFKLRAEIKELTDEEKEDKFIKYYQLLNHVCTEDDLNNVKLLTDNVKNCPKCNEAIFKSSGCDHMWCVKCHTMFNWSDLKITKTTTNPLYFQWLRQQGIMPARYDHPDARGDNQNNEECVEQLNFNQCLKIINSLENLNDKTKEKLIKFAKLIELVPKPQNEGYMSMYRMKYAYGLIDEKQYIKYLSTRYTSKFFIDNYNAIIINTIFMISEFFKHVKENKTFNLTEAKEIINIHNDAIKDFNKIYKNFRINLINNEFETEIRKDDKIVVHKILTAKYHVELDPNITYLECPYPNWVNDEHQHKLFTLYIILVGGWCIPYYETFHNKYYKYYFPKKDNIKIDLYNIFNNDIVFTIFKKERYLETYCICQKIIKELLKTNPSVLGFKEQENINYSIRINSVYEHGLTLFIRDFLKEFNVDKTEFQNLYKELQSCIIYNNDNLKDTFEFSTYKIEFEPYKKRALLLQKYLKYFYKTKNSKLLTELQKTKINLEKITSNSIFNKSIDTYKYILLFEKPLMEIFIKIQD